MIATAAETTRTRGRSMEMDDLLAGAARFARRCEAREPSALQAVAFPRLEFAWLAEAGLIAAPLRRDLGGRGLGSEPGGVRPLLEVLKRVGRGDLPVGRLYEGHVNALLLIQEFAEPGPLRAFADDARLGRRFAVWNTEGSNGLTLTPRPNGRYRLGGGKTFASGAGQIERPLVVGALPDGSRQMVVVAMERASQAVVDPDSWTPLGMEGSCSFTIDFTDVEVEADDLLGRPGDYQRQPAFSGGAIRFAAVQLGGAEALFEATRDHLRQTDRSDEPYQKARLGEMALAIESGHLWLDGAARSAEDPDASPEAVVAYANMVRTAILAIAEDVLRWAERSVGARGMLRPHPIERVGRDLTLYLRQPNPDGALADVGRFVAASAEGVDRLWARAKGE
jgi:alkylation response protein AidB-like acyl-CoA dehydrogenase